MTEVGRQICSLLHSLLASYCLEISSATRIGYEQQVDWLLQGRVHILYLPYSSVHVLQD